MAKSSARLLWANKLGNKKKTKTHTVCGVLKRENKSPFKGFVLGIDPSLRCTGMALLCFQAKNEAQLVTSKAIKIDPGVSVPDCLAEISRELTQFLKDYSVDHVAIEETIYVQNAQTAQTLGMVRGALIATARIHGSSVFQYPPLRVKQAVSGFGRASKEQLAKTVQGLLKCEAFLTKDEADAAGVALCHAFTFNRQLI